MTTPPADPNYGIGRCTVGGLVSMHVLSVCWQQQHTQSVLVRVDSSLGLPMSPVTRQPAWLSPRLAWLVSVSVLLLVAAVVVAAVVVSVNDAPDPQRDTGAVPGSTHTPPSASLASPSGSTAASSSATLSDLADAEVVHVIYTYDDIEMVEVWIDRVTGEAIVTTTDATGEVTRVSQRQGLTLTEYHLMFGHPTLMTRTVLSRDDPTLMLATLQLEQYRYGLETGGITRVEGGRTEYAGQPVIEVHAWPGGELEHRALLNPETLFPHAMFFPGSDETRFTYTRIEGLSSDTVDRSVFTFDVGDVQQVEHSTLLSPDDLTVFAAYPIYTLGDTFEGYSLERVERMESNATDVNPAGDGVLALYLLRYADGTDSIQVHSRAALAAGERDGSVPTDALFADFPGVEVSLSTGEIARIVTLNSNVDTPMLLLQLDRPDGYVTIQASDRELVLGAAEALMRTNAGRFPPP